MTSAPRDLFLCLDTSTPTARVAILDGDGAVVFASEATAERHSGHVMALCAEALRAAGRAPAELAGIACGGGPGSFTGLRVGLAAAKGLALPTGVPLFVVSSLEALALDILEAWVGNAVTAVPCLDAGKGEVYAAGYLADGERLVREVAPSVRLTPPSLSAWLVELAGAAASPTLVLAGNGLERHRAALGDGRFETAVVVGPTAVSVGRLALLQRARGEAADLATAVPLYGRPPDITVKRQPG
ncbi:MAG TPA: tRNA (adenosine(37)-N6)-threonylcarbamoyltransferase complex dimerization subunit type 1 TsaB [Polyangia bacterium]|nr:tRNA (adenosine(37)-N6)-threonylcarbamoyltransferase complex dimerization subunit type 1 TsaB [Polyangia bacterium]